MQRSDLTSSITPVDSIPNFQLLEMGRVVHDGKVMHFMGGA
jgi:hypothetical protein